MTPRLLPFLGCVALTVLPAAAELVPLCDWPLDGTRTALQMEDELIRNCGRVLERWDLSSEPPLLLDSLVLDSPPIDLLDWEGTLLLLTEGGSLRALDKNEMSQVLWSLEVGSCATELVRMGDWLLPMSPHETWPLQLGDVLAPVPDTAPLGHHFGGQSSYGGFHATVVGPHLVGDFRSCCEDCQSPPAQGFHLELSPDGSVVAGGLIPTPWQGDRQDDVVAVGSCVVGGGHLHLDMYDPELRQVVATLPLGLSGSSCLVARDSSLWLGRSDSLLSIRATLPPSAGLSVLEGLALPGIRDLQVLEGGLLAACESECGWLATDDGLELQGRLPGAGRIHSLAWSGDRLLVSQRGLTSFAATGQGLQAQGTLDLPDSGQLAAADACALSVVPGGVAVSRWPADGAPILDSVLPLGEPLHLAMLEGVGVVHVDGLLRILDLRQEDQPVERSPLSVGVVVEMAGRGDLLAVSVGPRVRLARVTPDSAAWVGELEGVCHSLGFLDTLLITSRRLGSSFELRAYDVAVPEAPVLLGVHAMEVAEAPSLAVGPDKLQLLTSTPGDAGGESRTFLSLLEIASAGDWTISSSLELPRKPRLQAIGRDSEGAPCAVVHWEGAGLELWREQAESRLAEPHPVEFGLSAAPNPFNPATHFSFTLERPGAVRLAVFDLLGREVSLLREGTLPAGAHSILFEASALASGIYFACLEAAGHSAVVKTALVR